jgi:VWFA-related protein
MRTNIRRAAFALALGAAVFGQELRHQVAVVNIEVPVRVFKGAHFADGLSIDDFALTEDGRPQKIEAVYFVRNKSIEKQEGSARAALAPDVKKRLFLLLFEMDDYIPQIDEVIDDFFTKVLGPDDSVWIVMPDGAVRLKPESLAKVPRPVMAEQIKTRLRKAIRWENRRLLSLLTDLQKLPDDSEDVGGIFGENTTSGNLAGFNVADEMANLRGLSETTFVRLAAALTPIEGRKHAFFFYQREAYRIPRKFEQVFSDVSRRNHIDLEKIRRLFSDASTVVHFLFVTKTQADKDPLPGMGSTAQGDTFLFEQGSGDFYEAFRELAAATGGLAENTMNPAAAFRKSVEASENYYLLYYNPSDTKPDGRYRNIVVEVTYRAGYIAKQ